MNPFPRGPADRAGGLYEDASDSIDANFATYVQTVLWKQGVDVTNLGPDQYAQLVKALWDDPYIQDLYQSGIMGSIGDDPTTGVPITDSDFESAINYELFDPTRTHNQFLLSQGLSLLQQSGRQLSSSQQSYAQNFGGGDPAVLNALARAAQDAGVPYNVALAVAMAESGLNPRAVGDGGTSFGLFQLHQGGELGDMSKEQAFDPYTNALTALRQFAAVAQQDPSITSDPGRWAAAAQRPADPTGYASRVNSLLQSGFGGNPSGIVPAPFDKSAITGYGYGYGDPDPDYASGHHEGIDYDMASGTPLYSPFAGTVIAQWSGAYGNMVTVRLDNGYELRMAHMSSFSVTTGQRVNPGDLLGESGSTGNSTGPHVHLEWRTPGGNPMDPHAVMDPILAGTATFRSLNLTGAEGQGVSATSARDRLLGIDPIEEAKHPAAVSAFQKYFGRHPTSQELLSLVAKAGDNPDALESWLRLQPSHIKGLSMGMYQDVKGNLDSVSQKMFGHAGTDGMVKDLADEGKTSPTAIEFWLMQQDIAGQMSPGQYATLHQLNQSAMQGIYNQSGFDPRIAAQQYQQAQAQGVTVPSVPNAPTAFPFGPADRNEKEIGPGGADPDTLLSTQ